MATQDATRVRVFDVWFRWQGNEIDPAKGLVVMEGTIESNELLAEYDEQDDHYQRRRVVAKVTKVFPTTQLPLDSQLHLIAIENGEYSRQRLLYVPDMENSNVSSRLSIPGYRIGKWQALEKPHAYKTSRGDPRLAPGAKSTFSQFRMGIEIERTGLGLYLKLFQALHISVAISFLACLVRPTDLDPRFGLGVGALFASVANSYVVNSLVPETGDFSLADVVNGLGILTIMVTLVESTISLYLYDRCGEKVLSAKLDHMSFGILVVGFVVVNAALVVAALL